MKILQLIDTLNPGGAERMCVNIANTLYSNGIDVIICATREGGSLQKGITEGIFFYCLRKKGFSDIKAFLRLGKIVNDNKIDIIHAHSTSLFWAVMIKIFYRDVRIIWHDHLGLKVEDRGSILFYKMLSYKIDGIIAVNGDLANWSKKNMKVREDNVILINNFPQLDEKEKSKENITFNIVCLANLRPQKDHETLIKAVNIIHKHNPDFRFKLTLAGFYKSDGYFLKLNELVSELELKPNIEFAGPVDDVAEMLSCADCGVLSSVSEGLPVSLLEYGMAALPVVVTDVGQCSEVVGNGEYGRIVPPEDPEAMAKELLFIINNRELAKNMGRSFMKHVRQNYGPDRFMNQYLKLLNKISVNA